MFDLFPKVQLPQQKRQFCKTEQISVRIEPEFISHIGDDIPRKSEESVQRSFVSSCWKWRSNRALGSRNFHSLTGICRDSATNQKYFQITSSSLFNLMLWCRFTRCNSTTNEINLLPKGYESRSSVWVYGIGYATKGINDVQTSHNSCRRHIWIKDGEREFVMFIYYCRCIFINRTRWKGTLEIDTYSFHRLGSFDKGILF